MRSAKIVVGIAVAVAICAVIAHLIRLELRTADVQSEPRRQLVLAVDGLSWEAFEEGRRRGMFRRFGFAGRHVAPYPSMSHPAWTEVFGTRRVFGARGNAHTIESRWFDLDAMRIADDPRQVIARQMSPYSYQRALDYYFDPLIEPLMYLPGRKLFDRELREAESAILRRFTGDRYIAYIGGADAMGHTHRGELWGYMARLDSTIERVADSLDARGKPADIWIVSDHGNGGSFVEGKEERYLTPINLDAAIRRAGLIRADTGHLDRENEVAVVTIALATMVNVYFADLGRRRVLAESVMGERGVDLITWLEAGDNDHHVVILTKQGAEAHLRWRDGEYSYERITGDPLGIPDSLSSNKGRRRWVSDAKMRAATIWGRYPDAPFRIVQSAVKQVENAPDLIINLGDDYCYAGDLGQFVRMVRTHGSLSARSSLGVVAGTSRSVPSHVRSHEISEIIGISPDSLLSRIAAIQPHDPLEAARGLATGTGWIATGRDNESPDATFFARARPIMISMDYFGYDVMRELLGSMRGDKGPLTRGSSSVTATRRAVRRADIVRGVTDNLDTLISLVDSLDLKQVPEKVRDAEALLRSIPRLSSLADIRDAWGNGGGGTGAGQPARRGAMALWTVPYYLDAVLGASEQDSVRDPRSPRFATDWHARSRARLANDPTQLLKDTSLARRLFREVHAERRLRLGVEATRLPLLYEPELAGITVVYVPGIYGELFDQEIWSRGMRAVHDRLGVRTVTVPVDGRCASAVNATRIVAALRDDTRRRITRGYERPRYLLVGYSKGGIDATEALVLAPDLARDQVAALVTVATPHRGTPVAERMDIPAGFLSWGIAAPRPAACDTADASRSLWPATRSEFWGARGEEVAPLTRYFSVSFVSDVESAHPWMKLTKRIGQFIEPNDGVVPLTSSRFPDWIPAVDLGIVAADHIAARLASSFPQDAFLEALVITVAELGALDKVTNDRWRTAIAERERRSSRNSSRAGSAGGGTFAASKRSPGPLPGGSSGWKPGATFSMTRPGDLAVVPVRVLSPSRERAGIVFRCDQRDMLSFRSEYEFYYDAGNGGIEGDRTNGFSIVPSSESPGGRACQFATRQTAIKMTTLSFQFRPVDFPRLVLRLRVAKEVTGVDPGKARRGKNDATVKVWLMLEHAARQAGEQRVLLGYTWSGKDASGVAPLAGSLMEAVSSKRSVVLSTLPEAWVVNIGGPRARGSWQTIERDLVNDLRRAYPALPVHAFKVVGMTLQSDSDESRGETEVMMESLRILPRASGLAMNRTAADRGASRR